MKLFSHLWTARGLVIFGFVAATVPVGATFVHVGDEAARMFDGSTHSWHHFFREGFGDLGAMAAILVILFAAPRFRSPTMWWVMLILMFGFYAPFWIGVPFMAELAAPNMIAEVAHLLTAVPAVAGCFLARRHFTSA
jgi:hypothetical protein